MTDNDPKTTGENGKSPSSRGEDQETGSDIHEEVHRNLENIFGSLDNDNEDPGGAESEKTVPAKNEPAGAFTGDEKVHLMRADAVGNMGAEEENVVDWVDDAPEPAGRATAPLPETPPSEKQPKSAFDMHKKPDEKRKKVPENRADGHEGGGLDAASNTPEPDRIATQISLAKPSPAGRPTPGINPKKRAQASPPHEDKSPQPAARTHPPLKPRPVAQEPRKPLTTRIIVWGAVLIMITVTIRYFATYSFEEPTPVPAETGLLFYKIAPAPTPPASASPVDESKQPTPAADIAQKGPQAKASAPAAQSAARVDTYPLRKYPYTIHMASYSSPGVAREEVATFRRGFQAYLVHTDLGEKGIWYRLFLGHFPTATAALDAINKYRFKDAIVFHSRYACLVGSYPSTAQAAAVARRLTAKGFLPYTIVIGKTCHLFVGAHPSRTAAEALLEDLSVNHFPSKLVER
jgi:septal ring-binding cell division protein DamX